MRLINRFGVVLVLLLPWWLIHARALAEISIDLVGALYLAHCAQAHDWRWLRRGWVPFGIAWWGWLVVCTFWNIALASHGGAALLQAILVGRFLVFVVALELWVLQAAVARRWLFWSLAVVTVYVIAQTVLQFVTGMNLGGIGRSADGELTGPFDKPRDGPSLVRMMFPVILPPAGWLIGRKAWAWRAAGGGLIAAVMVVMVLIGQRMPVALAVFGLVVSGSLVRRLRGPVAVGVAAALALIAASALVSPPAFYRLVTKFSDQMEHLVSSPYGLLAERSVVIVEQHPWTGRGYDGYASGCPEPRYYQAWHWPGQLAGVDPTGATVCLTHPHNLYLQAATDAGLPGLVLFCGLVAVWLWRLGRRLLRDPEPLRVGLFVSVLVQLWPIASTSPLISMPIGGWCFLLLGYGLAEEAARRPMRPAWP